MLALKWVFSAAGLIIAAGLAYTNFRIMLLPAAEAPEGEHASCIPFAGGIIGAVALLICPLEAAGRWCWVPFLIDPGSGLYTAMLAWALWRSNDANAADPPSDAAEMAKTEQLRRALVGCLLGGAIGDALGLANEGLSPARAAKLFPHTDRYHFLGRRGLCSDDTEHACLTAQALLATSHYTPAFRAERFARDLAWRLRFWLLGLPAGIGLATLKSILKLWIGFPPRSSGVRSAGNGPAMRSAIIGACFAQDRMLMRDLVLASTRLTHRDVRAEEGALAVALAAAWSASGATLETPGFTAELTSLLAGESNSEVLTLISKASASAARGESTTTFAAGIGCANGVSGYMPISVAVALQACFRHPGDARAALIAVVACGGDTDTVAAIAGGIIGAGVGKEGLPKEWLDKLWEWPRTVAWMEKLAACLAGTGDGRLRPGSINPFLLLLRNLFFLVVVLGHGLRRLLPPY